MQTIGLRKLADYGFEPPVQESAGKKKANKFSSIAGKIFMICFMLWVLFKVFVKHRKVASAM